MPRRTLLQLVLLLVVEKLRDAWQLALQHAFGKFRERPGCASPRSFHGRVLFVIFREEMQQRSSRIDEDLIKRSAQETDLQLIYKLDLSIQNLQRIEQLELVPKLRCLILSYNRVEQLEGLRVVPDLRELHAENNLLTRLGGLDGNKNLTVLNLANNQIEVEVKAIVEN